MTEKTSLMLRWIGGVGAMGVLFFIFIGTAWALEAKPMDHPALSHTNTQPSRTMYQAMNRYEAPAARPSEGKTAKVMSAMNKRLEFREKIQDLKNPVAYKALFRQELKAQNPNQRER